MELSNKYKFGEFMVYAYSSFLGPRHDIVECWLDRGASHKKPVHVLLRNQFVRFLLCDPPAVDYPHDVSVGD